MRTIHCFLPFLLVVLLVAGCADYSGRSYSSSEARSLQTVDHGTVVSVQEVSISQDNAGTLGALGGGVVGGILGNMAGGGRGRTLATVGGALAGAGLGYAGSKAVTNTNGLEITVRLDNGQEVSVTQGKDPMFAPGDKVRVLRNGTTARVVY